MSKFLTPHPTSSDAKPSDPTSSLARDLQKPVIVQILPELNLGGVERGTVEVARAIIAAGGKAVVVSNGGHLVAQLKRIGADHYTLPVHSKNPFKWGGIRRQLRKILLQVGADIVHVRSRAPAWIALPATKSMGLKTVSTVHGKIGTPSLVKKIYNAKILRADHVIAISHYTKNMIAKYFPKISLDSRLTVIHRGVDIGYFDATLVKQGRIVNEAIRLALPDDKPVVMMPARPTAWKGHQVLLQAVAKMPKKDFTLVLLGIADGSQKFYDQISTMVARLGLQSMVRLAEKSTDMPAAMMLADVVVMPSIEPEPFGRVAIEAQAMGRPVVAFDHGGATESIQHGETGFLANAKDADHLAEMIETALALGPRQRKKLAQQARAAIEADFTTDIMCDKTIAIYDALLSETEKS